MVFSRKRKDLTPFCFLLPPLIFLILIAIYPLLFSLKLSFFRWDLIDTSNQFFVGLGNFIRLLDDSSFWNSIKITFVYVITATLIEFCLGLLLATITAHDSKMIKIARSLLLIPMMMTPLVVGLMWRYILNPNYGIASFFAKTIFGVIPPEWLSDPRWALPTLIFVDVWQWTPFMFIILLAGIQSLPQDPFEAAQIDGAGKHQVFFHITLPLLRPVILIAILLRVIDTFRVYDLVYSMTRGGPVNITETLSWYIYQTAFKFFDFGYASALSWVMLIITMIICSFLLRIISQEA